MVSAISSIEFKVVGCGEYLVMLETFSMPYKRITQTSKHIALLLFQNNQSSMHLSFPKQTSKYLCTSLRMSNFSKVSSQHTECSQNVRSRWSASRRNLWICCESYKIGSPFFALIHGKAFVWVRILLGVHYRFKNCWRHNKIFLCPFQVNRK